MSRTYKNDDYFQFIESEVKRMNDEGIKPAQIAKELNLTRDTVRWLLGGKYTKSQTELLDEFFYGYNWDKWK